VPTSTTVPGVVLANGHADLAVRVESGQLVTRIKDGTTGATPTWRPPGGVAFHLTDAARSEVPAGPFDFLGGQGATVWQVPQTQKSGVPWLGWNTEEVSGNQVGGPVTWKLTAVEGPGTVAVFEYDAFGQPKVIMNTKDGLPDSHDIPLGTHAHGNWAFTKVGVYRLTVTHTAKLASGATSTSSGVVTFAVGSSTNPNGLVTGTTTTTGCGNGSLPRTGLPLSTMVGGGAVLVVGGAVLLALTYRRRRVTS
jgi:putative ABC transporter-associated repeat protein